jgi:hypothetical protein
MFSKRDRLSADPFSVDRPYSIVLRKRALKRFVLAQKYIDRGSARHLWGFYAKSRKWVTI